MKKITLVMSAILMAVLLAFAAAATPVEFEAGTDKSFDITYTGTEGQYYAIVIVEGLVEEGGAPSITEDSIQYIDQQTAGVGGAVSFEDVLLKVDGTQATVFLGGSDLDAPVLLGWVNKTVEATTFTVSGTVTSGTTKPATVTLTGAENYTATTENGVYTISGVAAGTYKMVITAPSQLSYTKNALVVEADVAFKGINLRSGDINATDEINTVDLGLLLLKLNSTDEACDINGTGEVNTVDLGNMLLNLNKTSVVED